MDMSPRPDMAEPADEEAVARIRAELDRARRAGLIAVLTAAPGWADAARGQGGRFHPGQAGRAAASSTEMTAPFTLGRKPSFNGDG